MNNIENLRNDLMRYLHCLPSGNFSNVTRIFKIYIKKEKEEKEYYFTIMQQYAAFCVKSDREKLPLLFAKEWFEKFKNK